MLLNNDRLSHWCLGVFFSWIVCFLLFGIPLFHLWLRIFNRQDCYFIRHLCGVQLAITPWLYSSRATPQNPDGWLAERAAAVFVWFSLTALLLFYYIQRGWPSIRLRTSPHYHVRGFVASLIILGGSCAYNTRSITMVLPTFGKRRVSQGRGFCIQ